VRYLRKTPPALALLLNFVRKLVASNWAVLRIIIRPRLALRPGILAYHTELRTDLAKTWLANMVTLTPGTLTLFISEDGKTLYIHTLDIDDPVAIADTIRRTFEVKLLELEQ
jgi:multicomponent Na+:H+ antiporter subunit E